MYYANSDYVPTRSDEIALAEDQIVDLLDSHDPEQYLVRTRPRKDERPRIGWVDACFLEKKSTNIGQVSYQLSSFLIFLLLTHTTVAITVTGVVAVVVVVVAAATVIVSMIFFLCVNDKTQYRFN